jgi:hypothetical protein
MTKMQLILVALLGTVTIGGAILQGRMTDRWEDEVSEKLATYTQRLEGVPTQIGDWTSQETQVNERQFAASHCHGRISRVYRNSKGQTVNVFLVSGKALHVTQHSPDWCYVAAGYEMKKDPVVYGFDVDGIQRPEFLHADFQKFTATETTRLRILWSFTEEGKWSASKLATYAFAGKPALYKVYLITEVNDQNGSSLADGPAVAFAKEFLPAIEPILFPSDAPANAPSDEGLQASL